MLSVISYGGGVQSSALIVLATQGEIHATHALFANVGDDSEHPETLRYVREVMTPWAAARGVEVVELHRTMVKTGETRTLWGHMQQLAKSVPIPVRNAREGAPIGRRTCTADYKIRVVARWLREHGARRDTPALIAMGISWDEIERLNTSKRSASWERTWHPLIDRRLTREDCKRIIERAGLPVPPKSSCFFCPFHRPSAWQRMRTHEPVLFWKSVDLERLLNARREVLGKDHVYLTRFGKPLDDAIPEDKQIEMDFGGPGETCDEGYCWT